MAARLRVNKVKCRSNFGFGGMFGFQNTENVPKAPPPPPSSCSHSFVMRNKEGIRYLESFYIVLLGSLRGTSFHKP